MSNLKDDGFCILKIDGLVGCLNALRGEVFDVFNAVSVGVGGGEIRSDVDIIELYKNNQPLQFQILKVLWGSIKLMMLAGNEEIYHELRRLGLRQPILELQPLLRCDMPVEKQSVFAQHQDYSYNIGSSNSVTVWIPLQDTNEDDGALSLQLPIKMAFILIIKGLLQKTSLLILNHAL